MIYYVADLHFGHPDNITLIRRPFDDVEDMNESLIDNWNEKVKNDDTVYVIGDMFSRCEPETAEDILKKLKGHKHLVIGDHDSSWMAKIDADKYFESVNDILEVNDANRVCVLCHYPLLTWKRENKTYMVYGHIHDDTDADFWPLIARRDNMLNAAVEINQYAPATFDELVANNRHFNQVHSDDQKVLEYRGYTGSIEVSLADRCLCGKVLDIDDLVMYDAETINDLDQAFVNMVDFYLECMEEAAGKEAKGSAVSAAEAEKEAEQEAIIEEVEKRAEREAIIEEVEKEKERDYFKEAMDEYDAEHEKDE